jgi:hypothetical protein
MTLDTIIKEFDEVVEEYNNDDIKGVGDIAEKDALHRYNDKFTFLYKELGPLCSEVYGWRTQHDDKSCSAFKARTARKMQEADPKLSWNKVTELAAATEEYKDFLTERVYYYRSWDSISHLRDSIKQYIKRYLENIKNVKMKFVIMQIS